MEFSLQKKKPLLNRLQLDLKSNNLKFRESAWKFFAYSVTWSYCSYLLIFSGKYDYFQRPWQLFDDWELNMDVPYDVTLLYFIECGFYLHSLYATVLMDVWRKDSVVMIIHHFIALALILVSYGTRYHKIGVLVLFVHDITDILLEFTKLNVYLKNRHKKVYVIHEYASNVGFAVFAIAW
jgi:ceramide synthetase